MPKLLDQVRQAIRTRHYSYRTEKAYVGWMKRWSGPAQSGRPLTMIVMRSKPRPGRNLDKRYRTR